MQFPYSIYHHTQRGPWCVLLYLIGAGMIAVAVNVPQVPHIRVLFPIVGVLMIIGGASFHHLTVADEGEQLAVRFGPLPLFQRRIRYDEIRRVAVDRTTLIEGWGIHGSLRGGWVWNIWGRDCVMIKTRGGILRVGTDDALNLAAYLQSRMPDEEELQRQERGA